MNNLLINISIFCLGTCLCFGQSWGELKDKFCSNPGKYNPVLGRGTEFKSHVITRVLNLISVPDHQTKAVLAAFRESGSASDEQKELILKICEDEE